MCEYLGKFVLFKSNSCILDTQYLRNLHTNVTCSHVKQLLLKAPGGSSSQWTPSNYHKVNPTTLFGYNVQPKKTKKP